VLPLSDTYTGAMTETPKLLAGDLTYILVESDDRQGHDDAARRGYYACNTEVLPDDTDPDEYRSMAETTLNRLLPATDTERTRQDRWRVQISEWGAREFANHALYRTLSRPTLRPGRAESVLGKTYEEARQYPSLAFRFGNDWDAFGYSAPAKHPGDQPVQELSILPVDLSEYQAARAEIVQTLGNVAWQHGLRAYVARETLKVSAYTADGEPRYTDPHIPAYSRIEGYKETAFGMLWLADQEPHADLHQTAVIEGTQYRFAINPWPRTRVRMQPGYFEYQVAERFRPEDMRAINFLREAIDLGCDYQYMGEQYKRIQKIPTHTAVVMRPGASFVRERDQKLLDSLGYMVETPDGVQTTSFWEQDYDEIAKEIFGDGNDTHTVMSYLSEAGLLMVNDNKLEINEAKLATFVSTLPSHIRRRFMTNPQDIVAKANQRLSVFYADVMPAVTVGRKFAV